MSGRIYNFEKMQQAAAAADQKHTGELIRVPNHMPECYKNSQNLTLDQIDARNVRIDVKYKKSYREPRVKITNSVITALINPHTTILMVKQLLALAVEARRRLRHPHNQSHVTKFKGPAWATMGSPDMKVWDTLTVTIDGKAAMTVTLGELAKELERKKEVPAADPTKEGILVVS